MRLIADAIGYMAWCWWFVIERYVYLPEKVGLRDLVALLAAPDSATQSALHEATRCARAADRPGDRPACVSLLAPVACSQARKQLLVKHPRLDTDTEKGGER